ncbi:MAG: hypothetical protein HS111_22420 [Kofleriaceae bacterium]|nr:hypothetical protein [Kofleriaceae bacterium]MCL4224874.1 hypothetical protein [Myxococcales bacterium]
MPDYSKIHDLVSHRVCLEYDTGARVVGMLVDCKPPSGPVEFVVLHDAKLYSASGKVVHEATDLTLCPNVLTGVALDEGPRGRDVK